MRSQSLSAPRALTLTAKTTTDTHDADAPDMGADSMHERFLARAGRSGDGPICADDQRYVPAKDASCVDVARWNR